MKLNNLNKNKEITKLNTKILKKGLAVFTIGVLSISTLAGCGKSETKGNTQKASAKEKGVQTIRVGSGTSYKPYAYLDEDGKAVGYEYDVLKEIDKLLPQYKFTYQSTNFDNILLSLDSGKIDLAAHQYEYTDERSKKYLFSKESYTEYITYITVLNDNDKIQSIDDLQGKKVQAGGTTSATNSILQDYNKEHTDKPIKIINTDGTTDEQTISSLQSGAWDATVSTKRDADKINKGFGKGKDILKTVGDPINNSKTYYLYDKKNTKLQTAVDGALKKLKENGKLAELSKKWLGADFTGE